MNTSANRVVPEVPPFVIAGSVMLLAVAAGRLIATGRISVGVSVAVVAAYLLVVSLDISLAIAAWVALLFFGQTQVLGKGTPVIAIVLVLAWLGAGGVRRGRLPVLRSHRQLIVAIVLFGGWITLSIGWASAAGRAAIETGYWWQATLVFMVVATSLAKPRDVVYVALAFVIGSVVAVTMGFLGVGNIPNPIAAPESGRLQAAGDPNYQAAAFLAAMFMAGGLMSVLRRTVARVGLLIGLAVITIGFFATQSRGGLFALAFALLAAFVLFRRQRRQILGLTLIAAIGLAVWLPSDPDALHRLTNFGGGGSGRQDLWTVAWRVFDQHPVTGVGVGNFQVVEPRYVLQPGNITHVTLISETPKIVHNVYLQLLAETGVIGLIAFLVVVLFSMRTSWLAARTFDAIGAVGHGNLARAVLTATIGMLAAMFFISNGADFRLWVLLAFGPVLHTLATLGRHPSAPPDSFSSDRTKSHQGEHR